MFLWLLIILIILSYFYATRKFDYWRTRGIPFDKPTPYIGVTSLVLFKHSLGTYLKELYEKFDSPLAGFFIFDRPLLIVNDPKIIKGILIENFQNFDDRITTTNLRDDPVGSQMLFLLKNPFWRAIRHKISVVFTSGKIKLMLPLIEEAASDLMKYMNTHLNIPLDAKELCKKYTTDVIASCAFGSKAHSFDQEKPVFLLVAKDLLRFTWKRSIETMCYFMSPFLVKLFRMKFLDPSSRELMQNVFWRVANERQGLSFKRHDLVDILNEIRKQESSDNHVKFDGDIVVAQAIQFFLAGYETSSTTACFAMYELAKHPTIQAKLRDEILEMFSGNNSITYEGIQSLRYLEMVIYETIRKYPILPFLDRRTKSDYPIPESKIIIEKGTAVFIPVLGLHYDPKYYPEPEKFDPERFSPESRKARRICEFLGFGEGPRICIGMRFGLISVKLCLINVLSKYEILPCDGTPSTIKLDPWAFLLTSAAPVQLLFKEKNTRQ